jgi:hypothetical protein
LNRRRLYPPNFLNFATLPVRPDLFPKRTSLKSGDHVVIYAHPMLDETFRLEDGSHGGYYSGAVLADGNTLGEIPAP